MATSSFKSTSKRGCDPSKPTRSHRDVSNKSAPSRRSRSVSAAPTTQLHFTNKRDNPLFSRHDSPPPTINTVSFTQSHHSTANSVDVKSGRSYSKDVDLTGRSSSSVGSGRRFRSVSRNARNAHESETEQEYDSFSDCNKRHILSNVVTNSFDPVNLMKTPKTWSTMHSHSSPSVCSQVPNWDDGGSGLYFSEAEEQTINEFNQHILSMEDDFNKADSMIHEIDESEVRRSIYDIQNDLVDGGTDTTMASLNVPPAWSPSPVEIVLDIRREYVKELEQSEERARKLRNDLAAEEHRGMELRRVLKELLPDSRVASLQRCRLARKSSIERRRMSKRLTDEALAYFDECISISTFDSSDLSSYEDRPHNLLASTPVVSSKSVAWERSANPAVCSNAIVPNFHQEPCDDDGYNQEYPSITPTNDSIVLTGPSSTFNYRSSNPRGNMSRFQENSRNCNTNMDNEKYGSYSQSLGRELDIDEYNIHAKAEDMVFDTIIFKNRIDSGSVHLCGGAAFSVYPFSFIF